MTSKNHRTATARPLLFACTLALITCGKSSKSETSSAGADTLITVTGSLSDWPSSSGSFSGYSFLLLDVDSGEIFRTVLGDTPGFTLPRVPASRKYNAMLLDSEYRFGWILQLTSQDKKGTIKDYQAFQLGTTPLLGSLSLEGHLLRSSQQENLLPVKTITFLDSDGNGLPDGFDGLAVNFPVNKKGDLDGDGILDPVDSDIDNDGVPNVVDSDIDDDGEPNTFDSDNNQDGIPDNEQDPKSNPLVGIPGAGFKVVFHEITVNDDNSKSVSLWFVFSGEPGTVRSVAVTSGSFMTGATYSSGEVFSGQLLDDGTHGDGVATDGVYSALVNLAATKIPENNQLVAFAVTKSDGTKVEYLQSVGTILSGSLDLTANKAGSSLLLTWNPGGDLLTRTSVEYQVLIFDANGKRVYTGDRLPATTTTLELDLGQFTAGQTYSSQVRALAPSPITGFPGSAWHSKKAAFTP